MNKKEPAFIFYELQPLDVDEVDFRLHLRADDDKGIKALKRWLHKNAYRKAYYYDRIAEYYTIKKNGKTWLQRLEKDPAFQMVVGIIEP